MDIVEATNDFQDWELLHTNSDSESAPVTSPDHAPSFHEIDSGGLIQPNYFSLDSENRYVFHGEPVGSDSPAWIDPGFGEDPAQLSNKEPVELWPDSSSERSEHRKFSELEEGGELGFRENEEKGVKLEVIEGKEEEAEDLGNYYTDSGGIAGDSAEFRDFGENSEVGVEGKVDLPVESQVLGEEMNENEGIRSGGGVVEGAESKKSGELEKRGIVWWKMPMEFLKYCMIRMSPVWTVSVAAAVMGFLILGRRLYKMKRKTRGLEIKVAVDDKVSVLLWITFDSYCNQCIVNV